MSKNFITAAILMVISSAAIAVMSALGKAAAPLISTSLIVFFQNLISFLFILPWALQPKSKGIKTEKTGWHILRAITGAGAWYGMFLAMHFTSLNNAVLLTYSAALWIPLLSWLVHKQHSSVKVWLGVVVGFIGISLILRPHTSSINYGDLIALSAGVALAVALLLVNHLNKTEPPFRILFYYFLYSSLLFLPLAANQWQHISWIGWLYLIGIGVSLAISQLLVILAYALETPSSLSAFMYSTLLFTALIDWTVWHNKPTIVVISGMLLVILGGILTTLDKSKAALINNSCNGRI